MQVLLVNQNATIERLVSLSTGKLLYSLDKVNSSPEAEPKDYDFIIIDSDLYDAGELASLKNSALGATVIMIVSKGFERPNGVDIFIEKPFLPTELVDILSSARSIENVPADSGMVDLSALDDDLVNELPPVDAHNDISHMSDDFDLDEKIDLASMDEIAEPDLDFGSDDIKSIDEKDTPDDEIVLDDIEIPYIDDGISVDDNDSAVESANDFQLEDALEDVSSDLDDLNLDDLSLDSIVLPDSEDGSLTGNTSEDVVGFENVLSGEATDADDVVADKLDDAVSITDEDEDVLSGLNDEIAVVDSATESASGELNLDDLDFGDGQDSLDDEVSIDTTDDISDLESFGQDNDVAVDDEIVLDDNSVEELALDDEIAPLDNEENIEIASEDEDDEESAVSQPQSELLADFTALDDILLDESSSDFDEELPEIEEIPEHKTTSDEDEDEEAPKVPASIFGDDEVQKLKDLLGEDEAGDDSSSEDIPDIDSLECDEQDVSGDIEVPSDSESDDEFGSMNEAGVAEALGMDYEPIEEDSLDTVDLEELTDIPPVPVTTAQKQPAIHTEQIELTGSDLLSMPIDRLKELLEAADITINITLKKKS